MTTSQRHNDDYERRTDRHRYTGTVCPQLFSHRQTEREGRKMEIGRERKTGKKDTMSTIMPCPSPLVIYCCCAVPSRSNWSQRNTRISYAVGLVFLTISKYDVLHKTIKVCIAQCTLSFVRQSSGIILTQSIKVPQFSGVHTVANYRQRSWTLQKMAL